MPGSFVDEALKWRHSDVLFTAPLDGHDAFVYVLVEHQSSDDPLMAFRMLRYVTRIWDQYERDHPKARRLPAVIPLVVYQGDDHWTSPVQLLDVIDLSPAAKQEMQVWLPRFGLLLGPDAKEAYVTTAEMLRAEGATGALVEALIEGLTAKFGPLPDNVPKTVHAAPADQIRAWNARAMTAKTLDEVFADPQDNSPRP